jgi:hypothetical protein
MGTLARPGIGTYAGDPVTTAVDVSRARFIDGVDQSMGEADTLGLSTAMRVVLVSAADRSVAATAAAMADGGPILFVRDGRLEPRVRDEILRLLERPKGMGVHPTVDIVGSRTAVPESVASQLRALGLGVRRFDAAAAAADAVSTLRGNSQSYVVVSDTDLSAVVSSVGSGAPVLLTDGAIMTAATAAKLDRMVSYGATPMVYAVGQQAQAAVRSSWPGKRRFRIVDLGGPDPGANSLAAVQQLYDSPGRLAVSTAAEWQDSLIATMVGPALVLDEQHGLETTARSWMTASQAAMRHVYVFGRSVGLPRAVGQAVYGNRFVVRRSPTDILG